MYAWGGSDPANWQGSQNYNYGSARARYDQTAAAAGLTGSRTYTRRTEPDTTLTNARGKTISSNSTDPIIIGIDETGSMASWPGEIFDRLPLFCQTLWKYRPNAEFAICALGDAYSDRYALQVTDFTRDPKELEVRVKALGCEGNGGGQGKESYELFGYYMLNKCLTPNATSPFLIIYGDEDFYPEVDPQQVRHYIGDRQEAPIPAQQVWQSLQQRFNIYRMHKPYDSGSGNSQIIASWESALGQERVIKMQDEQRAVDHSLGLIAKLWGEYEDFTTNLNARHDDSSVKNSVHASLRHIDATPPAASVITAQVVPQLPYRSRLKLPVPQKSRRR